MRLTWWSSDEAGDGHAGGAWPMPPVERDLPIEPAAVKSAAVASVQTQVDRRGGCACAPPVGALARAAAEYTEFGGGGEAPSWVTRMRLRGAGRQEVAGRGVGPGRP